MQFSRITSFVDLQIWNATSDGFSFVISFESRSGPGLHGRPGLETPGLPLPPSEVPFIGSSLKLR